MMRPVYLRPFYLASIAFAALPIAVALYAMTTRGFDLRYLVLTLGLSAVVAVVMLGGGARRRPFSQLPVLGVLAVAAAVAAAEVASRVTAFGRPTPFPNFRVWAVAVGASVAISHVLDTYARFDGRANAGVADA